MYTFALNIFNSTGEAKVNSYKGARIMSEHRRRGGGRERESSMREAYKYTRERKYELGKIYWDRPIG